MIWSIVLATASGVAAGAPAPAVVPVSEPVLRRPAPPPYAEEGAEVPRRVRGVSAKAFVVVDATSGRVLVARFEHRRRPIASLTKMMTGLLVAERGDLGVKIGVPRAAALVEPTRDDLRPGRRYLRKTLLYSAMLLSANDSAYALAADGGDGSIDAFYARMNRAAQELSMRDTTYTSANGLEDVTNLSSAYDQALLLRYALDDPTLGPVMRARFYRTRWARPVIAKVYRNHNRMLWSYPGTIGGKTGFTTRAGACLAVAVERRGRRYIAVVLGSRNIWRDVPILLKRAYRVGRT